MKSKLKLITIIVLSLLSIAANAQAKKTGGMGFLSIGAGHIITTQAQNQLKSTTLLGSTFGFNTAGLLYGGKGFGFYKRLMIGGGGYGTSVSGSNANGEATYSMAGGGLNIGYLFINNSKKMLYAFGGIGGTGSSLKVNNKNTLPMRFGSGQEIPAGENRTLSGGGMQFEAGIGFNRFVFRKNEDTGGFLIGCIAGFNFSPNNRWNFDATGTQVANIGNRFNFYFGLTFGAGGGN